MKLFHTLLFALVATVALTTMAEARLSGGTCSVTTFNKLMSAEKALAVNKYNIDVTANKYMMTCGTKMTKLFFDQHCVACGADLACMRKKILEDVQVNAKTNIMKLVDQGLSVMEIPECSAFIGPLFSKMMRFSLRNKRSPTMEEAIEFTFPNANIEAILADAKKWGIGKGMGMDMTNMMGMPVNEDRDDDDLGSIYGGSKPAYSYGGMTYNRYGYNANPTQGAMDAARRAGALTNTEAGRMGYSSNYRNGRNIPLRDEEDDLGGIAGALMSPAAFKIASWGQRVGPFVGPITNAIRRL